ncbi:MAG: phosphoribosylformylglycinamidine synthase subunit PurS [Oligoflexia bacterium]|nr:phosphoribosylformylglycinamidine synthase subunit PurS [Oligoflexia bacterium]
MKKFKVEIMPRDEALDPQGRAVKGALERLGFKTSDCRVGKVVVIEANHSMKEKDIQDMAEKILANPLIETYKVTQL